MRDVITHPYMEEKLHPTVLVDVITYLLLNILLGLANLC